MSRSARRGQNGRVTPKGTGGGAAAGRSPTPPRSRRPGPARPTVGRVAGPRRAYVPPTTNRTGYRGNR